MARMFCGIVLFSLFGIGSSIGNGGDADTMSAGFMACLKGKKEDRFCTCNGVLIGPSLLLTDAACEL